jgi:shikimate dehydrogenase
LLRNILGALITMPHKVAAFQLADEVSVSASIAGACNALRLSPDGTIIGDQFDGEGFVRGLESKEIPLAGESALVIGTGGVGRAICASLAGRGIKALGLSDPDKQSSQELQDRLQRHYPDVKITVEDRPYTGNYRLLVNATPLGMNANDPLPLDPSQLGPHHIVADVVLTKEMTPFLVAAKSRGCQTQTGLDMLYEQIPAYLRFFGLPTTTAQHLRSISRA